MWEGQPPRMQELPLQAELAWPSVDVVAGDREADRRKVHTDLMGTSGLEPHVEQRVALQELPHLEVSDRLTRLGGVERLSQRVAAIAPDRRLAPAAARSRSSHDQRGVVPFQRPLAHQILQTGVR